MKLDLPDVKWHYKGWTIPGQLKKIFEESGEVAEAVALNDPINTIREALDAIQTNMTLIDMVCYEYNINLDKFITQHKHKLKVKGYI